METFEKYNKHKSEEVQKNRRLLPGYKEITLHMIFDINLDGNFSRKVWLVADGHKTNFLLTNTF